MKKKFLDSFLGKTILITITYVLYWLVFYGSWFIMPEEWFMEYGHNNYLSKNNIILILLFFIIPLLSFFIPYFLKKIFAINKTFLYILHILLILLSVALFLILAAFSAISNFSSIG